MKAAKFLMQKRFGPFFGVQFLGAFNDNLYKQTLIFAIALQITDEAKSGMMVGIAAGLFILPYVLFSPLAGQICDKAPKSKLIRQIKFAEILIMALAAWGLWIDSLGVGMFALFCMGTQSTFFGPVKYALIPQVLEENELIPGNGLIEMGTFLAILLGTVAAGIPSVGPTGVSFVLLFIAFLGWTMSLLMPEVSASDSSIKIDWNPIPETRRLYHLVARQRTIFLSILGVSWFWYFGATVLTILPNYATFALHGDKSVVTVLLATFSISIGLGSLFCEKLSGEDVEIGLVPFGSFGITLFGFDIALQHYPTFSTLMNYKEWFTAASSPWLRVLIDVAGMGFFGSFFIVPLYALIQNRSSETVRARVIAANNIANALFMVLASVLIMILFSIGTSAQTIFTILALSTAVVSFYIFSIIPEFTMRFFIWILACTIYRLGYEGRTKLPRSGAAVLVCNHVSYIDWFIITAACNRPVRFVMYYKFYEIPVLKWFFKWAGMIPIAQGKESAEVKSKAFDLISEALKNGDLVCIFPEGTLTPNGELLPFRPGVEKILERDQVPVIPMALVGLWTSFFSRQNGKAFARLPRPSWRRISLNVGDALPANTKVDDLQEKVKQLLSN